MNPFKTIYVNKHSTNSKIFELAKKANPEATTQVISTNTKALKPEHNLISLSWKDRAKQKKEIISVLNRNSIWQVDCNGRSTDFLPKNMIQSGCGYLCSYCYLDRHGPSYIKLYDDCFKFVDFCQDIELNLETYRQKFNKETQKDFERHRDSRHNQFVTIDIGCDDQITLSNRVTKSVDYPGHVVDIVNQVGDTTQEIMLSFASKDADFSDYAQHIKHPNKNRIRLSLMPESHRKILELNTSKIEDRINSINNLVDMGFEVHINLSPIVITENFIEEYSSLLENVNDVLTQRAKDQMAYEIIFVTYENVVNENMQTYMPKAFEMITNGTCALEPKWNKKNIYSYSRKDKILLKEEMNCMINKYTPYSRIRYMF